MRHSRLTRSVPLDPIKTAIGVFVVLGVLLTGVGAYALLRTFGGGLSVLPAELAMTALFGVVLVAVAAATRRVVPKRK